MKSDPDRHAFRAWVRVHHPDAGGDPAEFAAGLQRWRAVRPRVPGDGPIGFRSRGGLWLIARWWARSRRREQRVR